MNRPNKPSSLRNRQPAWNAARPRVAQKFGREAAESSGGIGCLAAGLPLYAGKASAATGLGGGLSPGERLKLKEGPYGEVVRFLAAGVH
ncbi:hypothetical protein WJX75_004522 [Coccomyxa subellipsoidea]|uniref:Uncharacterized protein n=1 Tax=Coccomyxa subellipsoidea TaxID=248742 RepID=A0ABR2YT86_9CHLO